MRIPILLLAMLSALMSQAQEKTSIYVTFIVRSPALTKDSNVFITGGIPQLGNWDPGKVQMRYEADYSWRLNIELSGPATIEYKFTLGSWNREAADTAGSPFANFQAKITHDTVIKCSIVNWTSKKPKVIRSTLSGRVDYYRSMKGTDIRDRDVIVWLPPDYDKDLSVRYPVLYMHDGQNVFDAATSAFGAEWRADEIADSLIRAGKIMPFIVVAVYNTPDRGREYVPGKAADLYMDFIIKKLKFFIDSAYRTMPDPRYTITCGGSAGGTISFLLAWDHPRVFGKAICMSPAFRIDSVDCVTPVKDYSGPKKPAFFYFSIGGVGLESQLQPGLDEMIITLKEKGYKEGSDFVYIRYPEAKHFETEWSNQLPDAIKCCLPEKLKNQK